MTINELYRKCIELLRASEIENSENEARLIIQNVLSIDYNSFLMSRYESVSEKQESSVFELIQRRILGEPLQYILGQWDFYTSSFYVGEGVLIPRPETEFLCEKAIDFLKNKPNAVVYDLCSGSGCIGLSVKKAVPSAEVYLFELSDKALYYLYKNRESLGFKESVAVSQCDVLNGLPVSLPRPDIILSNPPYIKTDELKTLQNEVKREPSMALDGGNDGLEFYRAIFEKWLPLLNDDGICIIECGEGQTDDICELFNKQCKIAIAVDDFNGFDRYVIAHK